MRIFLFQVVREHYLRDDLSCGILDFDRDPVPLSLENKPANCGILDESPVSASSRFKDSHYVVVDTNVVLNQIDVLEADGLTNVVILQTVLQEVI